MKTSPISDLVAFRQAEAGGWIELDSNDNYYCPQEPSCDDCPFDKQCDALVGQPFLHDLETLPEWLLPLSDLRTLYPELFI